MRNFFCGPWIALVLMGSRVSYSQTVTWEEQAERLQFVSAAMLENVPMAEMPFGSNNVLLKSNVTVLPTVNPTVGAKNEKIPSSPVHGVPTAQFDIYKGLTGNFAIGFRGWYGYLPSGSEKLVGVKASIVQSSFGSGLLGRVTNGSFQPGFELGVQRSIVNVNGPITAANADDAFHVDAHIRYGALGFRIPALNLWTNVLVASRLSKSEFIIPSDGTIFSLTDTAARTAVQGAVGFDLIYGINLAVAQLFVQDRVQMTRMLVGLKIGI